MYPKELGSELCDGLEGRGGREVQGGAYVIHVVTSLHCTAETNNVVKQLYLSKVLKVCIPYLS